MVTNAKKIILLFIVGFMTVAMAEDSTEKKEINFLILGNSYSHFFGYLPQIAESFGDKINYSPLRCTPGAEELFDAIKKIESGEFTPISKEAAMKAKKSEYSKSGYVALESNYKKRLSFIDILKSRKWDYVSIQSHSSGANSKRKIMKFIPSYSSYFKENYPEVKAVYYHTTAYRNDEVVFKAAVNGSVYKRVREGYPYTEDLHYFDALVNVNMVEKDYNLIICPGGTALQNARYDSRWGEVSIDPNFNYFTAKKPERPKNTNSMHRGFKWSSKQRRASKWKWEVDSHPSPYLNYLTACVWYELMFKKSCVGSTYIPESKKNSRWPFTKEKCLALQQIAHDTIKGMLPPLRLIHPKARIQYGDILAKRAEFLLNSKDEESIAIAADCYHNLVVFISEHSKVKEAKDYLESVGKLELAEAAAVTEAKERPLREKRLKFIWDASGKTSTVDDKVLGKWDDL